MLLENKHIFVVEDDPTNLAIISAILRREGAHVLYERWGVDCVRKMTQIRDIDIILLDLMFPRGVTGFDVFEAIRQRSELKDIPVVAVTAADPADNIRRAMEVGFSGFISKPLDRREFAQQINAVLTGHKVWLDDIIPNDVELK